MSASETELHEILFEVARVLRSDMELTTDLSRVVLLATTVVQGCDAATVTLTLEGTPKTFASTSRLVLEMDIAQYANDHGPCLDAAEKGKVVSVDFAENGELYPHVAAAAHALGVTASLSFPVSLEGRSIGSLNLYSVEPNGFPAPHGPEGAILAAEVAVAFGVSQVLRAADQFVAEAQMAVDERAAVSIAEGIVMAQQRCSADQARGLLGQASDAERRSIIDVAETILRAATLS
ncbi:GAF and ANTAR domain-containing protein [soil metagenome]